VIFGCTEIGVLLDADDVSLPAFDTTVLHSAARSRSVSRTIDGFRLAPLAPNDSVRIVFDWHYEVSRLSGREGAIDPTTFYLAYFYPRVAVHDDYNGWDQRDALRLHG
jgi:hypothetical protein